MLGSGSSGASVCGRCRLGACGPGAESQSAGTAQPDAPHLGPRTRGLIASQSWGPEAQAQGGAGLCPSRGSGGGTFLGLWTRGSVRLRGPLLRLSVR